MIDTSQLAFPKPGHAAGRQVMSSSAYTRNKKKRWSVDRACERCGKPIESAGDGHFHHPKKRGMGGGKRDDRFVEFICPECHLVEEGQIQLKEIA